MVPISMEITVLIPCCHPNLLPLFLELWEYKRFSPLLVVTVRSEKRENTWKMLRFIFTSPFSLSRCCFSKEGQRLPMADLCFFFWSNLKSVEGYFNPHFFTSQISTGADHKQHDVREKKWEKGLQKVYPIVRKWLCQYSEKDVHSEARLFVPPPRFVSKIWEHNRCMLHWISNMHI